MTKQFVATYSFNVRRYLKVQIEANSPEEAEQKAKAEAEQNIEDEIIRIINTDGFGDAAPIDAFLYVDERTDEATTVIFEGELDLDE